MGMHLGRYSRAQKPQECDRLARRPNNTAGGRVFEREGHEMRF